MDSTEPAAHLQEEPQSERGAPGSRDTGSDEPGGGPVDRPAGTADADSDTTVDAQQARPQHPGGCAPRTAPTGDQDRLSRRRRTSTRRGWTDGATTAGPGPVESDRPKADDQPGR